MRNVEVIKAYILIIVVFSTACDVNSSSRAIEKKESAISPTVEIYSENSETKLTPQIEKKPWEQQEKESGLYSEHYPNLWTKIEKEKIEIFPIDWFSDFTYDDDGSLWMVGGFGVIHRKPNGKQTWYSLKNDLSRQFFTTVAISPAGEIWVGGRENALYRFDGIQWTNEGEKLPQPQDQRTGWLCYSKDISGIDFGPDGSTWIMNNGLEIYAQAYGQWVNIPFPKHLLPWAGGGGCPIGIQVNSETDITIKRSGCCMSDDVGYHFDGNSWSADANYDSVDDLLANRHKVEGEDIYDILGEVRRSSFSNWPFDQKILIPIDMVRKSSDALIKIDDMGVIWLNTGVDLFNNSTGSFENVKQIDGGWSTDDPDIEMSSIINFGGKILYYQEGKRPYALEWVVQDSIDYYIQNQFFAVDDEERIWFYIPDKGLIVVEAGNVLIVDQIPVDISKTGGIHITNNNSILISASGEIWEYDNGNWSKYFEAVYSDLLFSYFAESEDGVIYAATQTGVFQFDNGLYTSKSFVAQDHKPFIVPNGGTMGGCEEYNRNYTVIGNCPGIWWETGKEYHYEALYLGIQSDNSVIFVNNHIVAKLENGKWKSFFFDDFSIDSATVDELGYIYIVSKSEGLIKLVPDIFDSYEELKES